MLQYLCSTQVLVTMVEAKYALPENQEYEERSARIRKLREQVGGETDTLNTLTAALEAKKVQFVLPFLLGHLPTWQITLTVTQPGMVIYLYVLALSYLVNCTTPRQRSCNALSAISRELLPTCFAWV